MKCQSGIGGVDDKEDRIDRVMLLSRWQAATQLNHSSRFSEGDGDSVGWEHALLGKQLTACCLSILLLRKGSLGVFLIEFKLSDVFDFFNATVMQVKS